MIDIVKPLRMMQAADEIENLRKRLDGCEIIIVDQHAGIERLRAALQKLADPQWGEYRSDEAIVKHVVKIARAALGPR
jgi:hypothetical protein